MALLRRELAEARDQQAATAEILRLISGSPSDLDAVLDTIAERAGRLCDTDDVVVFRVEGDRYRGVAMTAAARARRDASRAGTDWPPDLGDGTPITPQSVNGRAILARRTIHVPDFAAEPADRYPITRARPAGRVPTLRPMRTVIAVPLLRDGAAIGTIMVRRYEVRPFTDQQIRLLETFAQQAVIAIENARLFSDLQERLGEQTATSEILRIISTSPTDVQPVLDAVAERAARLCSASDALIWRLEGEYVVPVAHHGAEFPLSLQRPANSPGLPLRGTFSGRAILERRTLHIEDASAVSEEDFPVGRRNQARTGQRTTLVTPLMREGTAVGAIMIRRKEVRPFTPQQIRLLETFADQATIAIENTRLFHALEERNAQLTEALEQQTVTAEVLKVISASPTELDPVLKEIAAGAARLCGAGTVLLRLLDGDDLVLRAVFRDGPPSGGEPRTHIPRSADEVTWKVVEEGRSLHVPDMRMAYPDTSASRAGIRTFLIAPLLRQGKAVGVLQLSLKEVRPFTDAQIRLVETFADQAVIAVENSRLFNQLQDRTRQLAHTVEQLEALGAVTQAVTSTLDLGEVLERIVGHASRLAGADAGAIFEFDDASQEFTLRATHRMTGEHVASLRETPLRLSGESPMVEAARRREPVQTPDLDALPVISSARRAVVRRAGVRAILGMALLKDDQLLGGLTLYRHVPGEFPPDAVALVERFAAQSALAIQNARLFREIEEKSRQIEEASQHKSQFLAAMSHELRTPLNAVIGFSEVLLERMFGDVNERQEEYLRDILDSGRHLLSLINDILDLSKVEAGRMKLEVGRFSLPEALESSLTMVRERAARHGIDLALVVAPEIRALGEVEADERKVKQVLFNLLSNAVKFTPDGGSVDVTALVKEGQVVVSVRDTGIGIAPEDRERVFEAFRQARHSPGRTREGTGLGLPLARRFVELHGGRMWLESAVGQGSTFSFALPVAARTE